MHFEPKTDKEIAEMSFLWPEGEYTFEVVREVNINGKIFQTLDGQSSNGNDMITLVLKVYNPEGKHIIVMDNLVAAMAKKFKSAFAVCNLLRQYNTGQIYASDFIGKKGSLRLEIQPERPKKDGGKYSARNSVTEYIVEGGNKQEPVTGHLDDDIPY